MHGQNHDDLGFNEEVDRVGEPMKHRAPDRTVHAHERGRPLRHSINGAREISRESRRRGVAVFRVPRLRVEGIGLRLWPEDDGEHGLPAELPLDLAPRDGRPRVSLVLGHSSIKLGSQFRLDREGLIALGVGQALPESNGQVGSLGLR